jgi:Predicted membrane protein
MTSKSRLSVTKMHLTASSLQQIPRAQDKRNFFFCAIGVVLVSYPIQASSQQSSGTGGGGGGGSGGGGSIPSLVDTSGLRPKVQDLFDFMDTDCDGVVTLMFSGPSTAVFTSLLPAVPLEETM